MLKSWVRKYLQFYAEIFCLSKPVIGRWHYQSNLLIFGLGRPVNILHKHFAYWVIVFALVVMSTDFFYKLTFLQEHYQSIKRFGH